MVFRGSEIVGYYIKAEEDVNLFVEDLGPKDGRVIFFIHGWPVNHKMFEYQMNQLPRLGFRCRLADDVKAVIDSLQLKEVTLAGFSMGGAIAIRYMARHGEHQVSKLALFGAAAPSFTKRPDYPYGMPKSDVNKLIDQTFKDRPEMLSGFGQIFFSKYLTDSFKNWFQNLGLEGSGHGTALTAVSLRDEDLRLDLGKINVTTAIFHGMKDLICPFIFAKLMNEGIKDSEIIPFKYSGHGLFYDELEKFNRELVRFLE
jgi:non-heme chloroperoxidase